MLRRGRLAGGLLLETGFLLALNPSDRNHSWALGLLVECRGRRARCFLSPAAPVEVSLLLRSRGLDEERAVRSLRLMEEILAGAGVRALTLRLVHAARAAELRSKYPELGFFDSLHAAVALEEGLEYGDLDGVVRSVVEREAGGSGQRSGRRG